MRPRRKESKIPLEVVHGESRNRTAASNLAEVLAATTGVGTLYLGYPVLATADERVEVDALLVSENHGLVAFLLSDDPPGSSEEWSGVVEEQDRLFAVLESHLGRHDTLRVGRQLAVTPRTATVFPSTVTESRIESDSFYGGLDEVSAWVEGLEPIESSLRLAIEAALQRVTTIKPRKRRASVEKADSKGAKLKEIERGIANLDRWQKAAAIESPSGPQRIRGLAGSGKTVVLALKAAYWHTQHPDWQIALTFQSRALYQQIADLVTRFTFEHSNDRPDPTHLQVMHTWGSRSKQGMYSRMAEALGVVPRDFAYARNKYGMTDAFRGICRELLVVAREDPADPIFDGVLIDEAQDLPPEFFQLVYLFTKEPKRITWGFDELQRLSEAVMPDTKELFGVGPSGEALVSLVSASDSPRRDIVLNVCYRNTPWALATAHAVGIGVYREGGLIQHPDDPNLWQEIGYQVVNGELEAGHPVKLERSAESYPAYFPQLIEPTDAVVLKSFDGQGSQDAWIAGEIVKNLKLDELEHDDILIVLPDSYSAKSRASSLTEALQRHGIPSHLAGVTTSADEIFVPGSVAMAHIYRAKGNEAPMVYVVDAQYAAVERNMVTRRNTLFTAITRSRAWVRVTGWGAGMESVSREVGAVIDAGFALRFRVPTIDELRDLRHIHRDRPAEQEATIKRATAQLAQFLRAYERGELDLLDLPPRLRTQLIRLSEENNGNDSEGAG